MVIYIPHEFEEHLRIDKSRIHIIYMNREDLHNYFPYYERLTAIRTSKLWNEQAVQTGWLSNAPQARLAEYNPLVMSKFMLLRDAARVNPWGARYHLWMDAGHLCAGDQNPTPEGTSFYRSHMAGGLFVTHWPYGTTTEVHGLTDKAMHLYMAQAEDPLEIVRCVSCAATRSPARIRCTHCMPTATEASVQACLHLLHFRYRLPLGSSPAAAASSAARCPTLTACCAPTCSRCTAR